MLKSAIPRPWVCSRCAIRQMSKRLNHSQTSIHPSEPPPSIKSISSIRPQQSIIQHGSPGAYQDDSILRKIFDSPEFYREFSQSSRTSRNAGLFQNRYLTEPQGFDRFASTTLEKAKKLVKKVLAASSPVEYHQVVKDLDRLSDLLCRVIDLSDFVRATHPSPSIQAAATRAYSVMFEYMNVLNTTTGLAEQLNIAMKITNGGTVWDEQEHTVAEILRRDFAKSAIDLPKAERERFVALSQVISEVGPEFVDQIEPEQDFLSFPSSKLKGMDPMLVRQFTQWGKVQLPSIGGVAHAALRSVEDEATRKQIFTASRKASKTSLGRLQSLLRKRAELAKLSKFESYAQLTLEDKMARSSQSVNGFLSAMSDHNRPLVTSEVAELLKAKGVHTGVSNPTLNPWDKDYYMSHILSSVRSRTRNPDFLSSYFSLGRVIQGLSRVFTRLYGIRFIPHGTNTGETWNPDVRRLDVVSETDGHVAVLYCDLFSRAGKSPNPAHFTLRCSRLIRHDEIQEAAQRADPLFGSPESAANDGMAIGPKIPGGVMQLPTIALICDFVTDSRSTRPALLSFNDVTTLFHEMGHAIHSILGRTQFQNVSGTRCATDFAELPSVLMEHFAADPSVLALFASHYETDAPLPYEMISEKLSLDRKFEGCDTENQIILSMLDQAYHSSLPLDPSFNSTQVYHSLQREHGVLPPDPENTCWQGFFGHLYGYGGSYYSYLFDRVLAKRVWEQVFKGGKGEALERGNGERFKDEVLKWGGARDPWNCLSNVLKEEKLEEGGEVAMKLVGSWGFDGTRRK